MTGSESEHGYWGAPAGRSLAIAHERRPSMGRGPQMNGISAAESSTVAAGAGQASSAKRRITVFLLDDHEIVRRGLRGLLEAEPDMEVIGEAGTAVSAINRMPALRPDVAVQIGRAHV